MNIWEWLAEPLFGTWSRLEVAWLAVALVCLTLNTVKLWLVTGDLVASRALGVLKPGRRADDRTLAAWWAFSNAVAFELDLLVFAEIGIVAGTNTPNPVLVGISLIVAELATGAAVSFSLYARVRLGLRRARSRGQKCEVP